MISVRSFLDRAHENGFVCHPFAVCPRAFFRAFGQPCPAFVAALVNFGDLITKISQSLESSADNFQALLNHKSALL